MNASWKTGKGKTRFDRRYPNLFGLEIQWKHQNGNIPLILNKNGRISKNRGARSAPGGHERTPFLGAAGEHFKAKRAISILLEASIIGFLTKTVFWGEHTSKNGKNGPN